MPESLEVLRPTLLLALSVWLLPQYMTTTCTNKDTNWGMRRCWRVPPQASSTADLYVEKDEDEDDLCIVCWENLRDVIFSPCMHMVRSCNLAHEKPSQSSLSQS